MIKLTDKVVIITGASSGIGLASAKLFANAGAKIVIAARRESILQDVAKDIAQQGGEVRVMAGDVCSEQYHRNLVEFTLAEFGRLDVAFNNAGALGKPGPVTEMSLDDWHTLMQTNLTSGFLAAKYQIPAMLRNQSGSLIFTSSFVGFTTGFPLQSAYAASKAGLIGLTKALATEFGSQGIRVNALLPGGTNTDMAREFGDSEEVQTFVKNIHALKRIAAPEEIAQSALYLASDMSGFTTGSAMLVDGGVSVCKT